MSINSTGHGGARIGAGRKRKPAAEKIMSGNAGRRPVKVIPSQVLPVGEIPKECAVEMVEPSEWLTADTKNTVHNLGGLIFKETWKWIKDRRCDHVVTVKQVDRDFEERGIAPPKLSKSGLWQTSTVKSILENEKYMGDVILQKTYARDFLSERRVKNTGQAPQKYVENNHPAIVDKATWLAAQAEMERRVTLRSTEETGRGRYSGQYAFSGKIECGCCGAGFRRHNHRGEGVWTCKQHIKSKDICALLSVNESYLEAVFVRTLNGLIHNRDEIISTVGNAVNEALLEAGEDVDRSDEVKDIDAQIEALQGRILELNKQRGRREIDAGVYNSNSREVMEKLDALFIERDLIAEQKSMATLSKAYQDIIAEFLNKAKRQDEFDKEIFARLVDMVRIKSRDNIVFILKDGTEVKANADDMTK